MPIFPLYSGTVHRSFQALGTVFTLSVRYARPMGPTSARTPVSSLILRFGDTSFRFGTFSSGTLVDRPPGGGGPRPALCGDAPVIGRFVLPGGLPLGAPVLGPPDRHPHLDAGVLLPEGRPVRVAHDLPQSPAVTGDRQRAGRLAPGS